MLKLSPAIATTIEAIGTPIARALHMSCIDPTTNQLRPESTCAKVKQDLNEGRYKDAIYDRFFPKPKQKKET